MLNEVPNVYHMQHRICSYDVDRTKILSCRAMLNLFQELANLHADRLGFGYYDLMDEKQAWVLSRMRIEITSRPSWNETIEMSTWTAGMNGLFGTRHYTFRNAQNENILNCASDWLIIDTEKRKPIRKNAEDFTPFLHGEVPTKQDPIKLHRCAVPVTIVEKEVDILDIDMMGHVNNIHYLAWTLNALLTSVDDDYFPSSIDLNYLHEIKWPATIAVQRDREDEHLFQIVDNTTGVLHFLARFN